MHCVNMGRVTRCHVRMGGVTRCDNGWSDYMCHVMMGGVTRCVV